MKSVESHAFLKKRHLLEGNGTSARPFLFLFLSRAVFLGFGGSKLVGHRPGVLSVKAIWERLVGPWNLTLDPEHLFLLSAQGRQASLLPGSLDDPGSISKPLRQGLEMKREWTAAKKEKEDRLSTKEQILYFPFIFCFVFK